MMKIGNLPLLWPVLAALFMKWGSEDQKPNRARRRRAETEGASSLTSPATTARRKPRPSRPSRPTRSDAATDPAEGTEQT